MLIKADDSELLPLADSIGEFIHFWGFKRIHGQLWTLIFLHSDAMSATVLSRKFGVSKSLVSLALKDLLHYEVIRKSARQGKRTIHFESNPDLLEVICGVLRGREYFILQTILSQ